MSVVLNDVGPTEPRFAATLRWWGRQIDDIQDWSDPKERFVSITQGYGPGIQVRLKEFMPCETDRLAYRWFPNGNPMPAGFAHVEDPGAERLEMPPFAFASVDEVTVTFKHFIATHFMTYVDAFLDKSDPILVETFRIANQTAQEQSVCTLNTRPAEDLHVNTEQISTQLPVPMGLLQNG